MQTTKRLMTEKRILVILLGVGLLAALLFGVGNLLAAMIFTTFLLMPGLALLAVYQNYPQNKWLALLPIPGMLLAGTGAILLFQSLTDYWTSWAYAWALYGVFLGVGMVMMGQRLDESIFITLGRGAIILGGGAFVVLGALFIMLTSPLLQLLLFVLLFAGVGYMLLKLRESDRVVHLKSKNVVVEGQSRKIA